MKSLLHIQHPHSTVSVCPSDNMSGWFSIPTPLKNMKITWDDDIPNVWKVIKFMFQTTNQMCFDPLKHRKKAWSRSAQASARKCVMLPWPILDTVDGPAKSCSSWW